MVLDYFIPQKLYNDNIPFIMFMIMYLNFIN